MRSALRAPSIAANADGSASASAVGIERSSTSAPSSNAHTLMLMVPGSMPTASTLGLRCDRYFIRSFATSSIVSASSTRSLRSNRADALLVHLHLEAANTQRAESVHALALHAVVVDLDALDAERRHGVEVGGDRDSRPTRRAARAHTGRSGIEQQRRTGHAAAACDGSRMGTSTEPPKRLDLRERAGRPRACAT